MNMFNKNVRRTVSIFVLVNEEGRAVDEKGVNRGERFCLNDGDKFHFEATLDSVYHSEDMIMVHWTEYDWRMEPEP